MCLLTSKEETDRFKDVHIADDIIRVWKVYYRTRQPLSLALSLVSPFYSDCFVLDPGTVLSNRRFKRWNEKDKDYQFHRNEYMHVYRGIHVYLARQSAVDNCSFAFGEVVVCCHAKMKDLVGVEYDGGKPYQAVFMKIFISPRNFRRAVKGK